MNRFFFGTMAVAGVMTISSALSAQADNALVETSPLPFKAVPFDRLTPADYENAIMLGIEQQNQEIKNICRQRSTPDFQNTIVALDRSGALLTRAEQALSNVEHANGDTTLMNIMTRVTPLLAEHQANILLNEALWNRIKSVYDNRDKFTDLTPEDQRLLSETYLTFAENGANLQGADREKYRKLSSELSDLNVRFAQNVTNDMKNPARRLWVEEKDMGGIPESIKVAARAAAKDALVADGKADDENLYLFTMYAPSYFPFMQYADNRDLREKLYKMYTSRNIGGEFDNVQVLKDIANVRLEIAQLLGKKNFAEYQLTRTMAANPEGVYNLLNQLREAYQPAMEREFNEIETYASEKSGAPVKLTSWDYSYWNNKLKSDKYSFNEEELKPYFELNNTIKGVFGLATKLYGYSFKERNDLPGYHPDVKAYEVVGPDNETLGVLYTDFFYRPGKAPGAWMTEFRGESKDDNGVREVPLISIVMNFSQPVGDEPVLLTPSEVNTFLHEFGHALHGLSTEAKYPSLSGTNVYHDFVELFSQFNENYLTEKEFLDGFAKHYKTGKKMPKALLDRFIKSHQFGAAYACMRQLNFGFLDMAYHTIESPLRASQDIAAFESKAIDPVRTFEDVEGCMISPAFAHIFSGGYAAGYYGYKWSEVLEADAFDEFKQNGIFNKKSANKFRKMLQAGGTVDPMTLYIEFRGKTPSVDALMRRDGIKK